MAASQSTMDVHHTLRAESCRTALAQLAEAAEAIHGLTELGSELAVTEAQRTRLADLIDAARGKVAVTAFDLRNLGRELGITLDE